MYPPAHIAFTYIIGKKFVQRPMKNSDVWLLVFFSIFPDIIDKTLHYKFGLFASGRNICHNIFIVGVLYLAYRLVKQVDLKRLFFIVFLGFITHFFGDIIPSLIRFTYTDYSDIPNWYLYVFFPVFDPKLLAIGVDWIEVFWESLLILAVFWIWIKDGCIGLVMRKHE